MKFTSLICMVILFITSCSSAENDTQGNQQLGASTTLAVLRLPTEQIYAFTNSYIASKELAVRMENSEAPDIDELTRCVQNAAINIGNAVLQTFTVQATAETAVLQAVQQNVEQLIAQCSTK